MAALASGIVTALTAGARRVLARAPQIAVALSTTQGPHCTPELFVESGGRLWCLTAANTLKARRLSRDGSVSFVATSGSDLVAGRGRATVIDAVTPLRNLRRPDLALLAPAAVGRFTARNSVELAGAAVDLVAGRLGRGIPPRRVAICIEVDDFAVVRDGRLVEATAWSPAPDADPASGPGGTGPGSEPVIDEVPEGLRDLTTAGPASVAWTTNTGQVVALAGEWDGVGNALVPTDLFELVGAASRSQAAIMRDEWTGYGPSGKQGLMLRGTGVSRRGRAGTRLSLTVEGVTYWDGVETGSAWVSGP